MENSNVSWLMEGLLNFGLSVNQAKVYLSLIQAKTTNINTIESETKIHRQDIYKILRRIEALGLISITLDRPIEIKVISPEKALNYLITIEESKADQRIKHLKKIVSSLATTIKEMQSQDISADDHGDIRAFFLSSDNAINHKFDEVFANARMQCDGVFNFEVIRRSLALVEQWCNVLAKNNVSARFILENILDLTEAQRIIRKIVPPAGNFSFRQKNAVKIKPYLIIDNREVLITTVKKTAGSFPCILCTNSPNIISVYTENFVKAWNQSKPLAISKEESNI